MRSIPIGIQDFKEVRGGDCCCVDRSDLDALSAGAVEQIHDRECYRGLKGRVLLYGMAFRGKDARVVSEELAL